MYFKIYIIQTQRDDDIGIIKYVHKNSLHSKENMCMFICNFNFVSTDSKFCEEYHKESSLFGLPII